MNAITLSFTVAIRYKALMTSYKPCTNYEWKSVTVLAYKEEGTHFKSITRRVLFDETSGIDTELRYFEILPGGYSTLESHEHVHQVLIIRGKGKALVGKNIFDLKPFDCIEIGPHAWHQFKADSNEPFGFLCLVRKDRDRPHRPDDNELNQLRENSKISDFIKI